MTRGHRLVTGPLQASSLYLSGDMAVGSNDSPSILLAADRTGNRHTDENQEDSPSAGPVACDLPLLSPLQIFGFVATFLCLASLWLSYKISCVTQSTGEFQLSALRAPPKGPGLESRRKARP
jgi:hypothetical protein